MVESHAMHVAIIMDGNGRWAVSRGLPRSAGHIAGAKVVNAVVDAAARAGIQTLTLYAFSAGNWMRPSSEVTTLMHLFGQYLFSETQHCVERSIRISVIGRRDRLPAHLLQAIEQSERLSADGHGMHLRIAMDYSSQYTILQAARVAHESIEMSDFNRLIDETNHSAAHVGDVDLLIRTGAERRLSDFMLWECAHAELYFSECFWPDFDEHEFLFALEDFNERQRRFGSLIVHKG
jgi:undecaprenyl diphosphate synthase